MFLTCTEPIVMVWDVEHSRHLFKYCKSPTSYLRVATIFKATSRKLLHHLMSLLRHSYEYPRDSTT